MKLIHWLSSLSTSTLEPYKTIYIVSDVYHSVCISLLLKIIQKNIGLSHIYITLSERQNELEHQFAISFLGQQQWYWLGSLDVLIAQQRIHWLNYLNGYQGPHQIWCHTKEQIILHEHNFIIELPNLINFNEFVEIARHIFPAVSQERFNLFQTVFKKHNSLSLDTACLIMQYASILSVQQIKQFITEWIDIFIISEHSLFTLSTLFFAKDIMQFLALWRLLKQTYSVHFWISYWSDQLFRAYQYICAKQIKNVTYTKKYAYRLPFSFIQRDWKKHNIVQLRKAHGQLYDLDFNLKQGGDEMFLDLWIYDLLLN